MEPLPGLEQLIKDCNHPSEFEILKGISKASNSADFIVPRLIRFAKAIAEADIEMRKIRIVELENIILGDNLK